LILKKFKLSKVLQQAETLFVKSAKYKSRIFQQTESKRLPKLHVRKYARKVAFLKEKSSLNESTRVAKPKVRLKEIYKQKWQQRQN